MAHKRSGSLDAIVYLSSRFQIIQAWLTASTWNWNWINLTQVSGAPRPYSSPWSWTRPDGYVSVVYRSSVHIVEMFLSGGNWYYGRLTELAGAPSPGSTAIPIGYGRADNVPSVVYRSGSAIHELYLLPGQNWQWRNLSDEEHADGLLGIGRLARGVPLRHGLRL